MDSVAIIGAPGYAGVELTRLVLAHPHLELSVVTSASQAGRAVGEVYPALAAYTDLAYEDPDVSSVAERVTVVFLAVPHTAAMSIAPDLLEAGILVIDASADFRLSDAETYESWYEVSHSAKHLLPEAVYGLPEMNRASLTGARLVACPGCYPTASILAALPALESGATAGRHVVVDAKSGVSGAGRTPTPGTHFPTVNESVQPYKVATHRHTPEIEQMLSRAAGREMRVTFSPHLVPMTRGLLSTVYLELDRGFSAEELVALYRERYADEPFVTVHDAGTMPSTAEVKGSNRAHIGLAVDAHTGTLIAACAIDNLVKGTSGQAIQCANIVLGHEETAGLSTPMPVV
ncbi:MAG: N-acetyl-gamma-glutamyl-phosphate reductase [Coriobacteriia bacterium]|nr:N-acetyl-gamma-glutamyl-phosphate reductase [Coriobacteriia bacterium]